MNPSAQRGLGSLPPKSEGGEKQWNQYPGYNREAAGQGDYAIMDFALPRLID
jgi:hypothetical protein